MPSDITELLQRASAGEEKATEKVVARVYGELERFAERQMRRRFGGALAGVTLEPAALVNETLMKVIGEPIAFANRRHFFAFANRVLLRVLTDYQRARGAEKRGGGLLRVSMSDVADETAAPGELSAALESLGRQDPRKAEIVNLRVFWGMNMREIANTLGVSLRTVERDWRFSRTWLRSRLEGA